MSKLLIVIQAGGRGTRLGSYTSYTPKALLSLKNTTLLYHNLDVIYAVFPAAEVVVIADHKSDVIQSYITTYPHPSNPRLHKAKDLGTAAGLSSVIKSSPGTPCLYLWCDLLLEESTLSNQVFAPDKVTIGLTNEFVCRWSVNTKTNKLCDIISPSNGVAGLFFFPYPLVSQIEYPNSGEFVRWLSTSNLPLTYKYISPLNELGDYKEYSKLISDILSDRSRFFNSIQLLTDTVVKTCIDPDYSSLLANEVRWYKYAAKCNYPFAPQLINETPLSLSRINGVHPDILPYSPHVIPSIISSLQVLHSLDQMKSCPIKLEEVYISKTLQRISSVENLLPMNYPAVRINNRDYINPFHPENITTFTTDCMNMLVHNNLCAFTPIHGDPTFSNTLYDPLSQVAYLIDPRGSFGGQAIFGDPDYDWAKILYSVAGSYDIFNKRDFVLKQFSRNEFSLSIQSSPYLSDAHLILNRGSSHTKVKLIHALIWFSLSGYVKNHVDSIVASFLQGCFFYQDYLDTRCQLSSLPKTWFLDVDGVLVKHNSQQTYSSSVALLPGVHKFLDGLSDSDTVVVTSARSSNELQHITEELKKHFQGKITCVSDLPTGERILINDKKPSGMLTSYSFNIQRDVGLSDLEYFISDTI